MSERARRARPPFPLPPPGVAAAKRRATDGARVKSVAEVAAADAAAADAAEVSAEWLAAAEPSER